jgi:multidrug resistance efflux pump
MTYEHMHSMPALASKQAFAVSQATRAEALAELERARLRYKSDINGVNTSVANLEAQLRQARYYLDNTCTDKAAMAA